MKLSFGAVLVGLLCMLSACSGEKTSFLSDPEIIKNPNPRVPLAAVLNFDAPGAVKTKVTLFDGDREWDIEFDKAATSGAGLPIVGMKADRTHQITVSVFDDQGNQLEYEKSLTYKTPPLPVDRYSWPPMNIRKVVPEKREKGFTILSVRRTVLERPQLRTKGQNQLMKEWGLLLGLDEAGEVVWYYESDVRISGIDKLANGNIICQLSDAQAIEIDMLGNVVGRWYAEKRPYGDIGDPNAVAIEGIQTLHHQPHETVDGNFLSFSANSRVIPNWYTNEYDPVPRKDQNVMGDTIIEFSKKGEILWSWNAFNYLDVYQIGYEAFDPYWTTRGFKNTWDWSHGNGVTHDERDDSVVASFKLLDAIVKIDKKTKDIKWIFGDHGGWKGDLKGKLLNPVGDDFRWPYHHHNPRWTQAGTLLVFNNNRGQTKPFDGRPQVPYDKTYSYTAEYEIDEEKGTVRQVWVSEPSMSKDSCVSFAMSEAHRLPQTSNILEVNAQCAPVGVENTTWNPWDLTKEHISEMPRGGRVREYTHTTPAEIVFDVSFLDTFGVLGWEVYGGFHKKSLYSVK